MAMLKDHLDIKQLNEWIALFELKEQARLNSFLEKGLCVGKSDQRTELGETFEEILRPNLWLNARREGDSGVVQYPNYDGFDSKLEDDVLTKWLLERYKVESHN